MQRIRAQWRYQIKQTMRTPTFNPTRPMRTILTAIALLFIGYVSAQETDDPIISTSYKGVAVDVFPMLKEMFAGDNSLNVFSFRYVRAKESKILELGLAPNYRRTKAGEFEPQNTQVGGSAYGFLGKQHAMGKRLFCIWGLGMRYGYQHSKSKNSVVVSGPEDFTLVTTRHTAQLGPEFKFGYHITPRLQIRSEVGLKGTFSESKTKIKDGGFNASDQTITQYNARLLSPDVLEIVYLF